MEKVNWTSLTKVLIAFACLGLLAVLVTFLLHEPRHPVPLEPTPPPPPVQPKPPSPLPPEPEKPVTPPNIRPKPLPPFASPTELVSRLTSLMKLGAIAFNTPKTMMLNQTKMIHLVLSPSGSVKDAKKAITSVDPIGSYRIEFSSRMEAKLIGNAFKISAITPEQRVVGDIENTEWKWDITALEPGTHSLHLSLYAIFIINGDHVAGKVRTFDQEIQIEVSFINRVGVLFKTYWNWVWGAIVIPIAGWLWKRRKKKQKSAVGFTKTNIITTRKKPRSDNNPDLNHFNYHHKNKD